MMISEMPQAPIAQASREPDQRSPVSSQSNQMPTGSMPTLVDHPPIVPNHQYHHHHHLQHPYHPNQQPQQQQQQQQLHSQLYNNSHAQTPFNQQVGDRAPLLVFPAPLSHQPPRAMCLAETNAASAHMPLAPVIGPHGHASLPPSYCTDLWLMVAAHTPYYLLTQTSFYQPPLTTGGLYMPQINEHQPYLLRGQRQYHGQQPLRQAPQQQQPSQSAPSSNGNANLAHEPLKLQPNPVIHAYQAPAYQTVNQYHGQAHQSDYCLPQTSSYLIPMIPMGAIAADAVDYQQQVDYNMYLGVYQQQVDHNLYLGTYQQPPGRARLMAEVQRSTLGDSYTQLKLGGDLITTLPICTSPTKVRQAYGMDKVWLDEFEQLFAQLASNVVWTLIEVEKNPEIVESDDIICYNGRYVIRSAKTRKLDSTDSACDDGHSSCGSPESSSATNAEPMSNPNGEEESNQRLASSDMLAATDGEEEEEEEDDKCSQETDGSNERRANELSQLSIRDDTNVEPESDCDSVAQVESASGLRSCDSGDTLADASLLTDEARNDLDSIEEVIQKTELPKTNEATSRRIPTRFRMFIDSAKVRFCCDRCGHGWTSMKGRVVFWYELFEVVQGSLAGSASSSISSGVDSGRATGSGSSNSGVLDMGPSNLVGYCAYQLFGQQCDVCKIENRFERPMWYPEEVCKVLNNLYNKIGQVYFGFKMPTIDKQRRAGKPKTSHNSSLCQACHDGVCTDRK